MRKTALALLALVSMTGCGNHETAVSESKPSVPMTPGHELFLSNCVSCHQGSGNPPGPNSIILDSGRIASEQDFITFLRQPSSMMMPPFSPEQLSDAQAGELYAYIKSVNSPQAAPQSDEEGVSAQ